MVEVPGAGVGLGEEFGGREARSRAEFERFREDGDAREVDLGHDGRRLVVDSYGGCELLWVKVRDEEGGLVVGKLLAYLFTCM